MQMRKSDKQFGFSTMFVLLISSLVI